MSELCCIATRKQKQERRQEALLTCHPSQELLHYFFPLQKHARILSSGPRGSVFYTHIVMRKQVLTTLDIIVVQQNTSYVSPRQ
jgi:hypothetical protein